MSDPRLPDGDYRAIMAQLSSRYEILKESPAARDSWVASDTRGLLRNLDSRVNPGGSSGLIGGLESLLP